MAWKFKETPKQKGIRGVGTVRLNKTGIKVVLDNNSDVVYDIDFANAPDGVKAGHWNISLSNDGTKMFGFSPVNGAFAMKFRQIACAEGQLPSPSHINTSYTDKDTNKVIPIEYDAFTCLLEIVKGKDAGVIVPYFLRYNFADVDGAVGLTHSKSKYTKQLSNFLESTGVFEKGEMTFSENILPALEARIKDKDHLLMVIMKDGYIDSLTEIEDEDAPKSKSKKDKDLPVSED